MRKFLRRTFPTWEAGIQYERQSRMTDGGETIGGRRGSNC